MHIVYFMHGFANQLFQLCLYRKLSDRYGPDAVRADRSFYDSWPIHGGFKLEPLYPLRYIDRLPKNCIRIHDDNFFLPGKDDPRNYVYIGYWQDDERYFPEDMGFVRDLLRVNPLSPGNQEILSRIESTNSVSIHVRRGDYIDHHLSGNIATPAFFANAISAIREKVENPSFYVFSDDPDWCRETLRFGDSPAVFVTGNTAHVELDILMMSACRHNIISNSSFSWWAQFLNPNPDKIVISPEHWFNPGINLSRTANRLNKSSFLHVKNYSTVPEPNENPFFTIIITAYNQRNGLVRCLSSVLNQTYGNLEILLADDASTDGSQALEEEYAKADARIIRMNSGTHSSLFASRLAAMQRARGNYILFVDGDDYLSSEACRILHRELRESPADILSFAWCSEPNHPVFSNPPGTPGEFLRMTVSGTPGHSLWNKCYSRELAQRVLGCTEPFYCDLSEDPFLASLFLCCTENLAHTDSIIYHRSSERERPISEPAGTRRDYLQKMIGSVRNRRTRMAEFLSERAPDLLPAFKKSREQDAENLFWQYKLLYRQESFLRKTALLLKIDAALGTHLLLDTAILRIRRAIRRA